MVADLQWGNLTNYQPENVFILSFILHFILPLHPQPNSCPFSAFHVLPPRPCMIYILTSELLSPMYNPALVSWSWLYWPDQRPNKNTNDFIIDAQWLTREE